MVALVVRVQHTAPAPPPHTRGSVLAALAAGVRSRSCNTKNRLLFLSKTPAASTLLDVLTPTGHSCSAAPVRQMSAAGGNYNYNYIFKYIIIGQ